MDSILQRESIILDSANIQNYIRHKRILITGAAGSIGSELLLQILSFDPAHVMAVDLSELGIYNLLAKLQNHQNVTCCIANITDKEQMTRIFQEFGPQVVFHAAAYKHVCLLETQPEIAVKNNIWGTQILADLAIIYRVEKFVFISTDKAVNPIGIMGISKRLSELYLLTLGERQATTAFIITRFGNVIGSSGSVFHVFLKHIQSNQPIPISHPHATRYLMAIPEAVLLVLESAAIGNGGEIMVFDMGEPVLILDLAHRMNQKFRTPNTSHNPEILIIGLKPGEKLHEELMHDYEKVISDHKGKMFVIQPNINLLPEVYNHIEQIHQTLHTIPYSELSGYLRNMFLNSSPVFS